MHPVYVTKSAQCLPGPPIPNAAIADYIGRLSPRSEAIGRRTLRQNGIRHRHYAVRPDGGSDWTLAGMTGASVRSLLDEAEIGAGAVGYLATATTQNDIMVPGLASQVHAESGLGPIEIASLQSVCASSIMALKAAALQVAGGEHRAAIAAGGEFPSRSLRAEQYLGTDAMDADGGLPGDAEFLRWTLSDGAAAVLIDDRPAAHGLSLRIDWISLRSFADRFEPCMTGGATRDADGALVPWKLHPGGAAAAAKAGAFQLRQDAKALFRMLPVWMGEYLRLVDEGRIAPAEVDWFLCHFSAHSLREEMARLATAAGCMIPDERWFTNLYDKGNVGAAALFLLIDDLMRSGRLVPGQRVLCAVPESGQCIMAFAMMTVVEGGR